MPRPIIIVLESLIFGFFRTSLLLVVAFGIVPNKVSAQTLTISGDGFKKKSAKDISGAICPTSDTRWCYAVNDEKNYLQLFSIDGVTLTAGSQIRLVEKSEFQDGWELDTEAIAYSDGFVYVAGSHSVKRTNGEIQLSRNLVFRFPVNSDTGEPLFTPTNDEVVEQIQSSDRLDELLANNGILAPYLRESPREN